MDVALLEWKVIGKSHFEHNDDLCHCDIVEEPNSSSKGSTINDLGGGKFRKEIPPPVTTSVNFLSISSGPAPRSLTVDP